MTTLLVPNETFAKCQRTTRDGRTLTYEMSVLQQPQRARACGSGAKSSADRRPVDPPPVVELKVFEGVERKDITFQHNANFFLFTTLESARQIAPARGAPPPQPHPVLTGMPVAGMAYLDRPTQAGYFIFPDLSVRHEGKFRLSFNLYEELKEGRDMDPEGTKQAQPPHSGAFMPGMAHVHFRLEVKSAPFTVFSAKKFPGLAESTQLSRLVAEQGCRVRIRRDVRMRRRETKPSKDFDTYSDEGDVPPPGAFSRDRFATPDSYAHADGRAPSGPENHSYTLERRTSSHEISGYYQQQQSAPQQQPPLPAPSGHPQFSNGPTPQYGPSQQPPQPNAYGQPYPYPQPHQQGPPPPPASSHVRQQSSTSSVGYPGGYNGPSRPVTTGNAYRGGFDFPAVDSRFSNNYDARPSTPSTVAQHTQLPPLKELTSGQQQHHGQPATPPASSPAFDTYASSQHVTTPFAPVVGKRGYSTTFDDSHVNVSITHGSRPQAVGADILQVECDDGTLVDQDELPNLRMLSYRRADGSRQHKKIPSAY